MSNTNNADNAEDLGYEMIESYGAPIKAWTKGVVVEEDAKRQLRNTSLLPIIFKHLAVMPDVHYGLGATVGSVIATQRAVIPAAVGVDIGCGMIARMTSLRAEHLPDSVLELRLAIERAIPHGFETVNGRYTKGTWTVAPNSVVSRFKALADRYDKIVAKHPKIDESKALRQLGSLGGGNHFIELCLDEQGYVWVMLHSGSRGVGNMIGRYFIEKARDDMRRHHGIDLPDKDLSYLEEGTELFDDYMEALDWAQDYALENRLAMMEITLRVMGEYLPSFKLGKEAINCHHNYVAREEHFGENVLVTRKGAVRARTTDLGIIPGSMGAKSYIVRGKGNPESFCSCSHGAGRTMSRNAAKKNITVEQHVAATEGVECRKGANMLEESPAAYKDIDLVMAAQLDNVEVVHTLKQFLCVKGE